MRFRRSSRVFPKTEPPALEAYPEAVRAEIAALRELERSILVRMRLRDLAANMELRRRARDVMARLKR